MATKDFNKMSPEDQAKALENALKKIGGVSDPMRRIYSAAFTKLEEIITQFNSLGEDNNTAIEAMKTDILNAIINQNAGDYSKAFENIQSSQEKIAPAIINMVIEEADGVNKNVAREAQKTRDKEAYEGRKTRAYVQTEATGIRNYVGDNKELAAKIAELENQGATKDAQIDALAQNNDDLKKKNKITTGVAVGLAVTTLVGFAGAIAHLHYSQGYKNQAKNAKAQYEAEVENNKVINQQYNTIVNNINELMETISGLKDGANTLVDSEKIDEIQKTVNEILEKINNGDFVSKEELENANKQIEELTNQLNAEKEKNASLTSENNSLNNKVKELNNTISNLKNQIAEKDSLIANLKSQSGDSSKYIDQINQLIAEKAQLQSQLDAANLEKADLQSQLDTANSEKAELESKLAAVNEKITKLEKELETAKTNKAAIQKELDAANSEKAELESKLAAVEKENKELKTENATLTASLKTAKDDLQAAKAEAAQLKKDLASANSDKAAIQSQLDAANAKIAELENIVAENEKTIAELEASVYMLKNTNNNDIKGYLIDFLNELGADVDWNTSNETIISMCESLLGSSSSVKEINGKLIIEIDGEEYEIQTGESEESTDESTINNPSSIVRE